MRFISVDIETTGLDPDKHQILEIAAVVGDFDPPIPTDGPWSPPEAFHCFVINDGIVGDPYALAMNAEILRTIACRKEYIALYPKTLFLEPHEVAQKFYYWVSRVIQSKHATGVEKITFAGKNFSGFDYQFLKKLPDWTKAINMHHRSLDVGSIYFQPDDPCVPSLEECIRRAGIDAIVTHRALNEAQIVVRLLRKKYLGVE